MHRWIARYEEGYVNSDGETVTLRVELRNDQTWATAEEAIRHWLSLETLSGAQVKRKGNGFIQVDDVGVRKSFRTLGVSQIWREITFVPSRGPQK